MGDDEAGSLDLAESPVEYHPDALERLTWPPDRGRGHRLTGSLTGAVASQSVTEARKGSLRLIGNQPTSAKA